MKAINLRSIKYATLVILPFICVQMVCAQNTLDARQVLDKAASIISNKGGAKASFTISSDKLNTSGTIAIKGDKFNAYTTDAVVWFDGKTQWAYIKKNDEVNVSNPKEAQLQSMNPYNFINLYKSGFSYAMKSTTKDGEPVYEIHLTAKSKSREIQKIILFINKSDYIPSYIKVCRGASNWTTIEIRNFQTRNISDNIFQFNHKDYPKAEIIDLR